MPEKGLRIHSTSHLIQPGYWLWLIQLASGPISIGVCADPRFPPWEEISSFDAWMEWLKRNEPFREKPEPHKKEMFERFQLQPRIHKRRKLVV
jgi:hypothetical protein